MARKKASPFCVPVLFLIYFFLALTPYASRGQEVTIDGKSFKPYDAKDFRRARSWPYTVYLSSVLTVDPLGIGGKSTYGIGTGARLNLWESRSPDNILQGLRIKGLYTALGYEFFPQQSDNLYASIWLRVKTFMPIAAKIDYAYSFGDGLRGTSTRYCVGFEVKNVSVFLAGTTTRFLSRRFGEHPYLDSPYTNVGSILVVIPVYNHFPEMK